MASTAPDLTQLLISYLYNYFVFREVARDLSSNPKMASMGFEPTTPALRGQCSTRLSYEAMFDDCEVL